MKIPRKYAQYLEPWYRYVDAMTAAGRPLADCPFLDTTAGQAVHRWLEDDRATMLVLAGNVGCGKSQAAAWGCHEVARRRQAHGPEMLLWWWLAAPHYARMRHADRDEFLRRATHPLLLVIDDLGREVLDGNGRTQAAFDELLEVRYASQRRTVITTNLEEGGGFGFKERYGERSYSRLCESGLDELDGQQVARWWVECTEADMRGSMEPKVPEVPPGLEPKVMTAEDWERAAKELDPRVKALASSTAGRLKLAKPRRMTAREEDDRRDELRKQVAELRDREKTG